MKAACVRGKKPERVMNAVCACEKHRRDYLVNRDDERAGNLRNQTFGAVEIRTRLRGGRKSKVARRMLPKGFTEQRRRSLGLGHRLSEDGSVDGGNGF